jgi:hypothetical protein
MQRPSASGGDQQKVACLPINESKFKSIYIRAHVNIESNYFAVHLLFS